MKKVSNRPANDDNEPVDVELPGFSLDDFFEFEQVTMDCDTVEAVIPNTAVEEHKFDFKLFNGVVKNVGLMDAVEKSQERIQKIEFDRFVLIH
ncbi:hypothetical protein BC833DRAFT_600610 [Globomyces pollinis-pini]|nr:hypothetical protein BC833DRAFT_600610 [Globomyces pollinis-pini]